MNRRAFVKTVAGIVTSAVCVGWGVISPKPKLIAIPYPEFTSEKSWMWNVPLEGPQTIIYYPSKEKEVRAIMEAYR